MANLGKIFDSDVVKNIEQLTKELANSGVTQPVGTTAFTPQKLAVHAAVPNVPVFDATANFDATAQASVSIGASGDTVPAFDPDAGATAPNGSSYAQLVVTGNVSGGINAAVTNLPLAVSANAAAMFRYEHFVPAAATETRLDALARVLTTAQLPQFELLTQFVPGEISRFHGTFSVDLGAKAKYGTSFDVAQAVSLFNGLSAQLKAHVQYSIEASIGFSVFDDMFLAVGAAQTTKPGWVRVRIDRADRKAFTAGATFALQVNYDASSIGTALEKAFDMTPLPRVIDILTTAATTDIATLQHKVMERASDEVLEIIAGTGWKQKLASDAGVVNALNDIKKVVGLYNSVDTKVKQLWAGLLARTGLTPAALADVQATLTKIAALNPQNPNLTQFLSPAAAKELDLLESLSGKNIEQLLVSSNAAVEMAIATAVKLAQDVLRVINGTPQKVLDAIHHFEDQFGIKKAIDFLANNATSIEQLEAFGDSIIRKLVERAVGVAFNAIPAAAFTKVQTWAKALLAKWDALSNSLKNAAQKLKGQVGFSLALEFSRVSESSAMLDFEFDPANHDVTSAVEGLLPRGNVSRMLSVLNDLRKDNAGAFLIRDALIVSRHLRTGTTSLLLSFVGLSKVTATTFSESVVRVSNSGRQATFSGGFTQAVDIGPSGECSTWIATDASDGQLSLDPPYQNLSRSLHLTFAHHSKSSDEDQRKALQKLVSQLGFIPSTGAPGVSAANGTETLFAMNVVLGGAAVDAFVSDLDEKDWNRDYLNAARRFLDDSLFQENRFLASIGISASEAEAAVVSTPLWSATWLDTSTQKFVSDPDTKMLPILGKPANILTANNNFQPAFSELGQLIIRRRDGLEVLDDLKAAAAASSSGKPADLRALATKASRFFASTGLDLSQKPLFNFWFVIARLFRLAPAALQGANGIATFRVRPSASADLLPPTQWTLTPAQGVNPTTIAAQHLFPF
jgi:hypothetical protein